MSDVTNYDLRAELAARETCAQTTCVWVQEDYWDAPGTWHTQCGNTFEFAAGGPCEDGINFCCYCGRSIERHDAPEPEEEDDD